MKPFDLEAAKRGEPMVTRAGRKVIHFHHIETDQSALCCVVQYEGNPGAGWIAKSGLVNGDCAEHDDDLFMVPKKRTVFVQIFNKDGDSQWEGLRAYAFRKEEDAKNNVRMTDWPVIGTFPIEIEID